MFSQKNFIFPIILSLENVGGLLNIICDKKKMICIPLKITCIVKLFDKFLKYWLRLLLYISFFQILKPVLIKTCYFIRFKYIFLKHTFS